jgi:hypothetical protein
VIIEVYSLNQTHTYFRSEELTFALPFLAENQPIASSFLASISTKSELAPFTDAYFFGDKSEKKTSEQTESDSLEMTEAMKSKGRNRSMRTATPVLITSSMRVIDHVVTDDVRNLMNFVWKKKIDLQSLLEKECNYKNDFFQKKNFKKPTLL